MSIMYPIVALLEILGLFAGVAILGFVSFRIQKYFERQEKSYTVRAFAVFRGASFNPMLIVHIDIVRAPGLLTPVDGTPLYRVTVNNLPWMNDGKGLEGVGFLFESEDDAENTLRSALATTGFTEFSPLTEF
jgi:hypothetical protein